MKYKKYIAIAVTLCLLPLTGLAAEIISSEETVTLDKTTNDDVYIFGSTVNIKEEVIGDALLMAQSINIVTNITQDVLALGDFISIKGNIGDDIHAAGRKIVIEGEVASDIFVMGSDISLLPNTTVAGDLYAAGEQLVIHGNIDGNARINSNNTIIKSGSSINGDLIIYGNSPTIEDGATVTGEIKHESPTPITLAEVMLDYVNEVVTIFLVALALLYLLPKYARFSLTTLNDAPLRSLMIGIAAILAILPVVLVLFISWIGVPIAFVTVSLGIIAYVTATGLTALFIGYWTINLINGITTKNNEALETLSWSHALLGAVIYEILQYLGDITGVEALGSIGLFLTRMLVIVAIGAVIVAVWRIWRQGTEVLD